MAAGKIIGAIIGSFVFAYACEVTISQNFRRYDPQNRFEQGMVLIQGWPRVAGPPVVMNPISELHPEARILKLLCDSAIVTFH